MAELEKMLLKEMEKAMRVASEKSLEDLYEGVGTFYDNGKQPAQYERTGALMNTPRTTALTTGVNSVSFDAYLDESHKYTSGSNPTMTKVLYLANDGSPFTTKNGYPARRNVGQRGFWEKGLKKVEKDFEDTMGKFFDKE